MLLLRMRGGHGRAVLLLPHLLRQLSSAPAAVPGVTAIQSEHMAPMPAVLSTLTSFLIIFLAATTLLHPPMYSVRSVTCCLPLPSVFFHLSSSVWSLVTCRRRVRCIDEAPWASQAGGREQKLVRS